jgi:hypothetical protein
MVDRRSGEQFCLKSGCHTNGKGESLTKADLTEMTSNMARNPHSWHHDKYTCSDCHKSHRASVLICTDCHSDAESELPAGWVDAETGKQIEEDSVNKG